MKLREHFNPAPAQSLQLFRKMQALGKGATPTKRDQQIKIAVWSLIPARHAAKQAGTHNPVLTQRRQETIGYDIRANPDCG